MDDYKIKYDTLFKLIFEKRRLEFRILKYPVGSDKVELHRVNNKLDALLKKQKAETSYQHASNIYNNN